MPFNIYFKSIFVLTVLLFLNIKMEAQVVSGYQGKRMLVNVNYNTCFALDNYNKHGKIFDFNNLGALNNRLEASLTYALKRQLSATVLYDHLTTGVYEEFYGASSFLVFLDRITANSFGAGLEWTSRKNVWGLAPMGNVMSIYFKRGKASIQSYQISEDSQPASEVIINAILEREPYQLSYNILGFKYFFRRFLAPGVTYNIGFNMNLLFNPTYGSEEVIEDVEYESYDRLLKHSLFYAQIGVGYFLF